MAAAQAAAVTLVGGSMSRRAIVWAAIAAITIVAVLAVLTRQDRSQSGSAAVAEQRAEVPTAPGANAPHSTPDEAAPATPAEASRDPQPASPSGSDKVFQVDSAGRLVLDEQTRLNMEALFARTERADLAAAKQQAVESLPPAESAKAADLLNSYDNYQQAQRQTYPPGVAPSTEEAAIAELDGLHALRIAHFGADVAEALYGAEERLSRSLIELMRLEKDQSLTMEEKAVRAQQLRDSMPELREQ
jgi:Proteobacterial lipase chaperone protein